jgi:UDP-N-acetylmuramate--alanine ligase
MDKKVHIIGIGGIAMSAIAKYFLSLDYQVTGSDLQENDLINKLRSKGVEISIGHQSENITNNLDKVIFSDAIPANNVELVAAKDEEVKLLNRSEALALITKEKKVISATGTHGKTSTSALIAQVLDGAHQNPNFIIGGIVNNFASNFAIKNGDYFLLEGDEYQRSFLNYRTDIGVITNIEFDHPDIYDDLADMKEAYQQYVSGLTEYLVTNEQVLEELKLKVDQLDIKVETVGINQPEATYNAINIRERELSSYFTLEYSGEKVGEFELPALGDYNIRHALEALAVGKYCGLSFGVMKQALIEFQGVKRRFETICQDQEQIVISDYAHHPSEVKAVVDNLARIKTDKAKVVVFQPHQYIRTKRLLADYQQILDQDITDRAIFKIYKVREKVDSTELKDLGLQLSSTISSQPVNYFDSYQQLEDWLDSYQSDSGVIYLFLGAGDIDRWVREWSKAELKS